jgi:tetratricopeptide (TPR) repeat protein
VKNGCAFLLLFAIPVCAGEEAGTHLQRALQAIQRGEFETAEVEAKEGLQIDPRSPAGHDLLGIAYDGLGRAAAAEKAFREALQLNPRFLPARNDLARNLYHTGKTAEAVREFEAVLGFDPANFTANYNLGLMARDAKRFAESARYLEAARQRSPSDVPTLLALVAAYLGSGQRDRALAVSRGLVSLGPDDPQIRFSLGTTMLEWKQFPEAAEHLERARLSAPGNFELLHDLGQAYLHLKNFSRSEDAFLHALSIKPEAVDTLYQLAVLYAEEGHADQAIQVLVRARQVAPDRPDVLLLLGREALNEGFYDDAIDVSKQAVRVDPGKIEPHLLLGESLTRKKLFKQALEEYQSVATLAPRNPQTYVALGRTYLYLREYPNAEQQLNRALALDSRNAQAAYYLGLVSADRTDYKSAERWFRRCLQSDSHYFPALFDLAVNCARQDDYACARDYFERAKAISPSYSQVYYRLSSVYRRLKEPDRAAENFALFKKYEERDAQRRNYYPQGVLEFVSETQDLPEAERLERYRQQLLRAAEMKPDDLNVLFMLAQVYLRTGQKEEAIRQLDKISAIEPDSVPILMRSAALLTAFHSYPEALAELQTALAKHPDSDAARFALAALYYRMGRAADAVNLLSSQKNNPSNAAVFHNLLGRAWIRQGEVDRGLAELKQAVDLSPQNEEYLSDLALESAAAGRLGEAQILLERAQAKLPSSARIRFAQGLLLELSGKLAGAERAYQQAAELSWQWEAPYLAQGHLFRQTGQAGRSGEVLEQATALFPWSPWPHWFKAATLRKSMPGSEDSELNRGLDLARNEPEIYPAMLADALRRDDCTAARAIWDQMSILGLAPRLDPSSWCDAKANQVMGAPIQKLETYSEWRVLVELAREENPASASGNTEN